jgi:hypothetical protein
MTETAPVVLDTLPGQFFLYFNIKGLHVGRPARHRFGGKKSRS